MSKPLGFEFARENWARRYELASRRRGLSMTLISYCCNPECGAPLYLQLMREWDTQACEACDPPREGLPTAFLEMAAAHGIEVTPGMTVGDLWGMLPEKDLNGETWL